LEGQSLAGTWTLEVRDDQNTRTGTLNSWSLTVDHTGHSPSQPLLAAASPARTDAAPVRLAAPPPAVASVQPADLTPLFAEAVRRWPLTDAGAGAALPPVTVQIADLPGQELGEYRDGVVYVDVDAAGHGWFVDPTPRDDREFIVDAGSLVASRGRAAQGMDLLSVIAHELGHAAGLDHADTGVMVETLLEGTRTLAPAGSGGRNTAGRELWPAFALTRATTASRPPEAGSPAPVIDWTSTHLDDERHGNGVPSSPRRWVWDSDDQGGPTEARVLPAMGRRWAWKTPK
jgi:hypothetical protein